MFCFISTDGPPRARPLGYVLQPLIFKVVLYVKLVLYIYCFYVNVTLILGLADCVLDGCLNTKIRVITDFMAGLMYQQFIVIFNASFQWFAFVPFSTTANSVFALSQSENRK